MWFGDFLEQSKTMFCNVVADHAASIYIQSPMGEFAKTNFTIFNSFLASLVRKKCSITQLREENAKL